MMNVWLVIYVAVVSGAGCVAGYDCGWLAIRSETK